MKVTISDNLFVHNKKSAFADGDNLGIGPSHFEWELGGTESARFVTDSMIKYAAGPGQIAWLLEPFSIHPENYFAALDKKFDAVLTHNRYFCENFGWLWYPHGGCHISSAHRGIRPKSKKISILLSNKNTLRGHKLRHEIVDHYGAKFDGIFGLDGHVSPLDAYGPYRYSVVVENERADGYFTERLIDCMTVGTIPVYWGWRGVTELFYPEGIIQFNRCMDLESVFALGESAYKTKEWAVMENCYLAAKYVVCEDRIYDMYPELFLEAR